MEAKAIMNPASYPESEEAFVAVSADNGHEYLKLRKSTLA